MISAHLRDVFHVKAKGALNGHCEMRHEDEPGRALRPTDNLSIFMSANLHKKAVVTKEGLVAFKSVPRLPDNTKDRAEKYETSKPEGRLATTVF